MTLHVAVDFGTSSTCVAVSVDGREPQVVVVDGGGPVMPSAVFAAADGTLFVGQEADRQAAIDPSRYEPHPKRRIDEGELLLGSTVIDVLDVVRAVLARAVTEARRFAGGAAVDVLVLTHPADWGAMRARTLRQAAHGFAQQVALLPEPVAAAVVHAADHALQEGAALAVLDLGGGTVDVSVVRREPSGGLPDRGQPHRPASGAGGGAEPTGGTPAVGTVVGFRVLATHGDPNFGGADIDQLLVEHIGLMIPETATPDWRALMDGREMADRRRRRALRQDIRGAKETLSRHAYTDVPLPHPFADAHLTREDLERLITQPLYRAVALAQDTINEADLRPQDLAAVFLVGGSSRIPLVARLVQQRIGIMPTTMDQPETVVVRGALRAAIRASGFTGGTRPGARQGGASAPTSLPGAASRPPMPGRYAGPAAAAAMGTMSPPRNAPTRAAPAGLRPGPPGPPSGPPGPRPGPPGTPPGGQPLPRPATATPSAAPAPMPAEPTQPLTMAVTPKPVPRKGASAPAVRSRRGGARGWVIGAVVVVVAVVAGLVIFAKPGGSSRPGQAAPNSAAFTTTSTAPSVLLAQYEYKFNVPDGWAQSGGQQAQMEVQIVPENEPSTANVIYVREYRLSYDAVANRDRFISELQPEVAKASYQRFVANGRYAGRQVAYYQQPGGTFTADWYVLLQGNVQVSVGCQYPPGGEANIDAACQQVVRSMVITGWK